MTIHKKTKTKTLTKRNTDAFMEAAPDGKGSTVNDALYEKGIAKGNKRQISITISPELLRQVDERAAAMGTGRSAFISMALFNELKK